MHLSGNKSNAFFALSRIQFDLLRFKEVSHCEANKKWSLSDEDAITGR